MDFLCQSARLAFGLKTAGKLVVFRTEKEFSAARGALAGTTGEGLDQQVLTSAECTALEPALRLDVRELAGGIYTASEQVGDCAAFCAALQLFEGIGTGRMDGDSGPELRVPFGQSQNVFVGHIKRANSFHNPPLPIINLVVRQQDNFRNT